MPQSYEFRIALTKYGTYAVVDTSPEPLTGRRYWGPFLTTGEAFDRVEAVIEDDYPWVTDWNAGIDNRSPEQIVVEEVGVPF